MLILATDAIKVLPRDFTTFELVGVDEVAHVAAVTERYGYGRVSAVGVDRQCVKGLTRKRSEVPVTILIHHQKVEILLVSLHRRKSLTVLAEEANQL